MVSSASAPVSGERGWIEANTEATNDEDDDEEEDDTEENEEGLDKEEKGEEDEAGEDDNDDDAAGDEEEADEKTEEKEEEEEEEEEKKETEEESFSTSIAEEAGRAESGMPIAADEGAGNEEGAATESVFGLFEAGSSESLDGFVKARVEEAESTPTPIPREDPAEEELAGISQEAFFSSIAVSFVSDSELTRFRFLFDFFPGAICPSPS